VPTRFSFHHILLVAPLLAGLAACSRPLADPFPVGAGRQAEASFQDLDIAGALDRILAWHEANRTDIPAALKPGLPRQAALAAFEDMPCRPTEELLQLWAWHDGADQAEAPFIWYLDFLSAGRAIEAYRSLAANPLFGWPADWIPVFTFEGEWYFTVCGTEMQPAAPVGFYFPENGEAVYTYTSLSAMLETSAAYLERGAVVWDGGMVEDIRRVFEIHQELNPGAQFPYFVK